MKFDYNGQLNHNQMHTFFLRLVALFIHPVLVWVADSGLLLTLLYLLVSFGAQSVNKVVWKVLSKNDLVAQNNTVSAQQGDVSAQRWVKEKENGGKSPALGSWRDRLLSSVVVFFGARRGTISFKVHYVWQKEDMSTADVSKTPDG